MILKILCLFNIIILSIFFISYNVDQSINFKAINAAVDAVFVSMSYSMTHSL
jgi:hypothetical protein